MTAIAELVALLLSTGIPPESVSAAVDLAQHHAIEQVEIHRNSAEPPQNSVETADDRRRAKDRERKRKIAESKKTPLIPTSLSTTEEPLKERKKILGIRARARKQLSPLPENWRPPDNAYPLAAECGTTVQIVEPIFRDYLKSSGKLYADHDAAFCNFLRNQRKFNKGQSDGPPRRGIIQAIGDLHQQIAGSFDGPTPEQRREFELRDSPGEAPVRLLSNR